MRLSVVVPVLNEEKILRAFLHHLREFAEHCEIVVVDGGSADASYEIACEMADCVMQSSRGRAAQMNAGAKVANGEVFWFVHADSLIKPSSAPAILAALEDSKVVGGCFRLRVESRRWVYRARDAIGNLLVDLTGIALGDRGFFCRRDTLFRIGGYPEIWILEDAEFYRALKRHGRVVQLREVIRTSPRRYEALGPTTTMLFYALIMLLYTVRVPIRILERLVRAYMTKRLSD
jgi:rSAM/selenodomain-associated transferase 2